MQAFLRLSLIVAIILSCVAWHTPEAHCASSEIKLPLEISMQTGDPLFTVEVIINGQGPFRVRVRYGCASGPTDRCFSCREIETQIDRPGPGHRSFPPELPSVRDLQGRFNFCRQPTFDRCHGDRPQLSEFARPLKVDGILGLNAFADYLVTLDFPAKKLRFEKGELPKSDGAEILDYKNDAGIALVELTVGDKKIQARLDTGNGVGAFVFPTAFAEKLSFAGEPRVVGRARSATGEMEIKQVQLKDMIKLGRHEFTDAMIVYPALGDLGNVGLKTLSGFAVTFDQRNQRLRLTKNKL